MSQKSESNDLTAYELQRLENIRRNEEFLNNLGLNDIRQQLQPIPAADNNYDASFMINKKERKRKIGALKSKAGSSSNNSSRSKDTRVSLEPLRRSRRLSGHAKEEEEKEEEVEEEEEEEEELRLYSDMPMVREVGPKKQYSSDAIYSTQHNGFFICYCCCHCPLLHVCVYRSPATSMITSSRCLSSSKPGA
jgi:hypothetical protein